MFLEACSIFLHITEVYGFINPYGSINPFNYPPASNYKDDELAMSLKTVDRVKQLFEIRYAIIPIHVYIIL